FKPRRGLESTDSGASGRATGRNRRRRTARLGGSDIAAETGRTEAHKRGCGGELQIIEVFEIIRVDLDADDPVRGSQLVDRYVQCAACRKEFVLDDLRDRVADGLLEIVTDDGDGSLTLFGPGVNSSAYKSNDDTEVQPRQQKESV